MGDIIIFYFLQNVLLFTVIFWIITWGTEYFYKKKNHLSKKQFYECGFKTLSELNIQINLNFSMLCVFLILYDVEFTLLFPILFNMQQITIFEWYILVIFILFIIISLIYDWQTNSLNWHF